MPDQDKPIRGHRMNRQGIPCARGKRCLASGSKGHLRAEPSRPSFFPACFFVPREFASRSQPWSLGSTTIECGPWCSDIASWPHPGQECLCRIPSRGKKDNQVSKKIYVGNLPFSSTEADLKNVFGRHGAVASVSIITDRETGRPRGFAFVEMEEARAADDAIRALDGSDLGGRDIKVSEAQDRRGGAGSNRY